MHTALIDPSVDKRWDEFVLNHPYGTIYHHSSWKELIQRTYGHKSFYFVLDNGTSILAAIPLFLIKSNLTGTRMVSLPFSDYCDPLIGKCSQFESLFESVKKQALLFKATQIEFKVRKCSEAIRALTSEGSFENRNHVLDLSGDINAIRKRFNKSSIQRSIKKAERTDVEVVTGGKEEDMRIFYDLYVLTRKKHGLPPQPYKFFRNMWHILTPRGRLRVLLARYKTGFVAGILVLCYKETMYYLYGGSDRRFNFCRPNHLLLWTAIKHAHREEFKVFDFGRTAVNNQGLLDFKRKWGTDESKIYSHVYTSSESTHVLKKINGQSDTLIHKLMRKLPVPLLKLSGRLVYNHMG